MEENNFLTKANFISWPRERRHLLLLGKRRRRKRNFPNFFLLVFLTVIFMDFVAGFAVAQQTEKPEVRDGVSGTNKSRPETQTNFNQTLYFVEPDQNCTTMVLQSELRVSSFKEKIKHYCTADNGLSSLTGGDWSLEREWPNRISLESRENEQAFQR